MTCSAHFGLKSSSECYVSILFVVLETQCFIRAIPSYGSTPGWYRGPSVSATAAELLRVVEGNHRTKALVSLIGEAIGTAVMGMDMADMMLASGEFDGAGIPAVLVKRSRAVGNQTLTYSCFNAGNSRCITDSAIQSNICLCLECVHAC